MTRKLRLTSLFFAISVMILYPACSGAVGKYNWASASPEASIPPEEPQYPTKALMVNSTKQGTGLLKSLITSVQLFPLIQWDRRIINKNTIMMMGQFNMVSEVGQTFNPMKIIAYIK